ncbi:hypothetical protein [Paenibacillus albidus]|uniref:hypothetical protein n=1 Tax=Paenibacillus albidus TaxID=2041023 RepID=UPI001BE549EB|nr:hypothetical protein [Paenibacillus albidus]
MKGHVIMGYKLSNGVLTVDIADQGEYRGSRFDWTGFITQVTLERGGHTFCVPESLIPGEGSGGQGLCNEFGISRAIGYEGIKAGDWFPKPGVGLLQKLNDQPYSFTADYPVQPFAVKREESRHALGFTSEPLECGGYCMLFNKTISLQNDILTIQYKLENTGTKPIHTEEYMHNFIGINGMTTGPEFELRLPGNIVIEAPESSYTSELLALSGDRLSWRTRPDRPFYCKLGGWEQAGETFAWELRHKPSGIGVRESGDFRIARMALWGEQHVISPEVFVNISLLPRQSKHWRRIYRFFSPS